MARVVVLGAGVAGHTAALHLRRRLGKGHEVVVVTPNSRWNWIPSNIWVGVGKMRPEAVTFPLEPIYRRKGIVLHQAKAVALRPHGDDADPRGAVDIEYTGPDDAGRTERLRYDYLVNATAAWEKLKIPDVWYVRTRPDAMIGSSLNNTRPTSQGASRSANR